jgi:SAM-dependent methyltransferase
MTPEHTVRDDGSRFTHGAFYHALYDRPLAEVRRCVVDLVPRGSTILDIGSGTGELCFELAARKECRVVGVDLSRRMIEFARRRNRHDSVRFVHGDASDLADMEPGMFNYATVLLLLHELSRDKQVGVLKEALRVAREVIVVDSKAPLPWNLHGVALRMVEVSGGREHYRPFSEYLASGGIPGTLADSRVRTSVVHHSVFWHGCRELVVLDGDAITDD